MSCASSQCADTPFNESYICPRRVWKAGNCAAGWDFQELYVPQRRRSKSCGLLAFLDLAGWLAWCNGTMHRMEFYKWCGEVMIVKLMASRGDLQLEVQSEPQCELKFPAFTKIIQDIETITLVLKDVRPKLLGPYGQIACHSPRRATNSLLLYIVPSSLPSLEKKVKVILKLCLTILMGFFKAPVLHTGAECQGKKQCWYQGNRNK